MKGAVLSELQERKKILRKEAVTFRRCLSFEKRIAASQRMIASLVKETAYQAAKTVFAYVSMPEEIALDDFLERAIADGKILVIPLIQKKGVMDVIRLRRLEDLVPDAYGIKTVRKEAREIVPPESIDLIVVPGAAFDVRGGRLGLGAGFYDRFMREKATGAKRIALAFDGLIYPEVPMTKHDERVDLILTEKRRIETYAR